MIDETPIDFRRSLPPPIPGMRSEFARVLDAVSERCDLDLITRESVPRGREADRMAGARLLAVRLGFTVPTERIVMTNGTQSALLLLFRKLVGANGVLLSERLSYSPLSSLAALAGVQLRGLNMDEQGILPDAFEKACAACRPKALYLNPTVQNPTTSIMPEERRTAIGEIARHYGVAIIEDDPLGRLHIDAPKPIAAVASDVTWYVTGLTKCLAQGLRIAYLVAPSHERADNLVDDVEHLSYWHPAPVLSAMVTKSVELGVADRAARAIAAECEAREALAREILAGFDLHSQLGSMHVWLVLPPHWKAADFAQACAQRGVLLRPAQYFCVDSEATPQAARLSLSIPQSSDEVRKGLQILRQVLK